MAAAGRKAELDRSAAERARLQSHEERVGYATEQVLAEGYWAAVAKQVKNVRELKAEIDVVFGGTEEGKAILSNWKNKAGAVAAAEGLAARLRNRRGTRSGSGGVNVGGSRALMALERRAKPAGASTFLQSMFEA